MVRPYLRLEQVPDLPIEEAKQAWERHYGAPAPNISLDLLRLGLGYRIQEKRQGSIGAEARALLRQASRMIKGEKMPEPRRKLMPGTRLVRDWHGAGHTITVLDDGYEYDGKTWASLSAIAKAITGTHWNGPAFFGVSRVKR